MTKIKFNDFPLRTVHHSAPQPGSYNHDTISTPYCGATWCTAQSGEIVKRYSHHLSEDNHMSDCAVESTTAREHDHWLKRNKKKINYAFKHKLVPNWPRFEGEVSWRKSICPLDDRQPPQTQHRTHAVYNSTSSTSCHTSSCLCPFLRTSQEIGWRQCPRHDLFCVQWEV